MHTDFLFIFFQDYIILDEGHKIKNTATKTAKNLRLIPAKHRFILTGTPVQNNLRVSRDAFEFNRKVRRFCEFFYMETINTSFVNLAITTTIE